MRLLRTGVFALAVAGSTLAGSGLVVAPHVDPPGSPRFHDHVLAAYRLPLFFLRLAHLRPGDPGPRWSPADAAASTAGAALVMGLLVALAPRLPRPARRPVAVLPRPAMRADQWSAPLLLGPPRTATLPTVLAI